MGVWVSPNTPLLLAARSFKRSARYFHFPSAGREKPALVSVYEASGRFLSCKRTIDILCNGAGCMHSASPRAQKYFSKKYLFTCFLEVWRSIAYIMMTLGSGDGGGGVGWWLSREDGLLVANTLFCACVPK